MSCHIRAGLTRRFLGVRLGQRSSGGPLSWQSLLWNGQRGFSQVPAGDFGSHDGVPIEPLDDEGKYKRYTPEEGNKKYSENQKKKKRRNAGKGPHAGKTVSLPSFIGAKDLARKSKLTLQKLAMTGRKIFPWWPEDTRRTLKLNEYGVIKELIFTFEEASKVVNFVHRIPVHEDPDSTDLEAGAPNLQPKIPVVTILGHFNHGKTTLLDAMRGTKLAEKEPFGITQDTYSFQVQLSSTLSTTFLDTPGHQNFFNMRANGVFFSDVVLLVVAADQGCLNQTIESLKNARAHNVPVVVAINKMDAEGADLAGVRRQLQAAGLDLMGPEEELAREALTAGSAYAVPISALHGDNVPLLMSTLEKVIRVMDLRTDLNAIPAGACLEAFNEPGGRGNVARMILSEGVLRVGQHFVCGSTRGRVRGIRDEHRKQLKEVPPGQAFDLWGAQWLPDVGDDFFVATEEGSKDMAMARLMEFEYPFQTRILALNQGQTPDDELSDWESDDEAPTVHTKYSLEVGQASESESENDSESESEKVAAGVDSESDSDVEAEWYPNDADTPANDAPAAPFEVVIKTNNVGALRMLLDSLYRFNKMHGRHVVKAIRATTGKVMAEDLENALTTSSKTVYCLRTGFHDKFTENKAREKGVQVRSFPVFHQLLDAVFEPIFQPEASDNDEEIDMNQLK